MRTGNGQDEIWVRFLIFLRFITNPPLHLGNLRHRVFLLYLRPNEFYHIFIRVTQLVPSFITGAEPLAVMLQKLVGTPKEICPVIGR